MGVGGVCYSSVMLQNVEQPRVLGLLLSPVAGII